MKTIHDKINTRGAVIVTALKVRKRLRDIIYKEFPEVSVSAVEELLGQVIVPIEKIGWN